MSLPQNFAAKNYLPATLKKYQTKANGWCVEYYVKKPESNEFIRQRIKLNRERDRFHTTKEFRLYANEIIYTINNKLAGGWSPFLESKTTRYYTPITAVIDEYLNEKKRELRPATLVSYKSHCNIFSEWVQKNVPNIKSGLFNKVLAVRYLDDMYRKNISARSYNNYLKAIRTFFAWCVEKCYCKENPFLSMKVKREEPKKRIIIPPDVRKRIADYCCENNPLFLLVCDLVFSSLIRPKEIRSLRVGNVFLEQKYIQITTENAKTHHERFSALSAQSCAMLENLHLEQYSKNAYLIGFDYRPDKKPIPDARFRKDWDKMRKELKLPAEMQLYSLRDTGINNMLKSGIDPLTVMQHADHHDLSMTTRYANHADKRLIETINARAPKF